MLEREREREKDEREEQPSGLEEVAKERELLFYRV